MNKRLNEWDCRLSKERRTDTIFFRCQDDVALIRIQSEENDLLLSTRNLGHRDARLKEIWYGDVRSGCGLFEGIVMGVILISNEG